jgi:hypothetical protein
MTAEDRKLNAIRRKKLQSERERREELGAKVDRMFYAGILILVLCGAIMFIASIL